MTEQANNDRDLGRLEGAVSQIGEHLQRVDDKLDEHIKDEAHRLMKIEHQLSLARFVWLLVKAAGLTVAFVFAFKFGDISNLWRDLK